MTETQLQTWESLRKREKSYEAKVGPNGSIDS